MKIGICYPMTMEQPRQRDLFLAWCEAADKSPLATIGLGDRIAYESQDPLVALAVAAGATKRVRLLTTVIALPTRHTSMFAKEVASLDVLSGGRFTLGVGASSRPLDFACLHVPYEDRVKRFRTQVQELREIWAGKSLVPDVPPIGPLPLTKGGPEILFGPILEPAFRRAGRLADGIITWSFTPEPDVERWKIQLTQDAWRQAGRPGRPKVISSMYFALGDKAEERLMSYLKSYYSYSAEIMPFAMSVRTYTKQAVKDAIAAYADLGVDEMMFAAADPGIDQVERLAELA